MNRVVLKGYYGYGNLGDDILMLVSARLMEEFYPNSSVCVASAGNNTTYIMPFSDWIVTEVVPYAPEPKADMIVHGGGGTYYDFEEGNMAYYLLNRSIELVGTKLFRKVLEAYRKLKGWPSNRGTKRIAIGIGIGTFTSSSKKYYHKIAELSNFDLLVPRDPMSYQFLNQSSINGIVLPGSDLAFLTEYWLPKGLNGAKREKNIGFILKNCNDVDHLNIIREVLKMLNKDGFNISIFIFEKNHDMAIERQFRDFPIFKWLPESISLSDYLESLNKNSLLVTSRAHGAIIGSALGIPSVCIGIEPKLEVMAKTLPLSSLYVPLPLTIQDLHQTIMEGLNLKMEKVRLDFDQNVIFIKEAVEEIKNQLRLSK